MTEDTMECRVTPITGRLVRPEHDPIVYCAARMRGVRDFNFPAFDEARDYVNRLGGYWVISPADVDREEGLDLPDVNNVPENIFELCMRRDLEIVAHAFAIFLLKGWEESAGANNELFVANACGAEVWLAQYGGRGKLIGHEVATEPVIPPMVGAKVERLPISELPEMASKDQVERLNIPFHTTKWAADRIEHMSDEHTMEELDDTLSLPPSNPEFRPNSLKSLPEILSEDRIKVGDKDPTILEEANGLIYGPRQDMYGHPFLDFTRSGRMWGAIIGELKPGEDVSPEKVGLCMVATKISREVNRPKRDNIVDMAGYAGCVDRIQQYKEEHASEN